MHVRIDGKNDPDMKNGSEKTINPSWWPKNPPEDPAVVEYMKSYIRQGHLLNAKIGGPGNERKNLTPITASTNSTHFTNIEKKVVELVGKDYAVEYRVIQDYNQRPTSMTSVTTHQRE